jgi:diacylglycerol O-acyltransferase
VTNVHGPPAPLYMLGSRLVAMYPQLPLFTNQGLGVAVMSYRDKVSFGTIADWDLVPDLSDFARALEASFAELQEAAERA